MKNLKNLVQEQVGEHWDDVVETVCHLVNATCESMENESNQVSQIHCYSFTTSDFSGSPAVLNGASESGSG